MRRGGPGASARETGRARLAGGLLVGLTLRAAVAAGEPAVPAPPAVGTPAAAAIAGLLASNGESVAVGDVAVDGVLARELYAARGFAPLWAAGSGSAERRAVVVEALRGARSEGLDPAPYHVAAIESRLGAASPHEQAELDLLLSDAIMRYAVHVRWGAHRPTRTSKEVALQPVDADPVRLAQEIALAVDTRGALAELPPRSEAYRRLRESLARHREIEARGGWPAVADGPKLEPGQSDARVPALRERLLASGDLAAEAHGSRPSSVYDPRLVAAVKRFQARHGLSPDATIGPRTTAALRATAADRVRQIEIGLERLRWMPDDLGGRHVTINIPDFRLELSDGGSTVLEMPVIVGKPSWPTPTFSTAIHEVVFNPAWNVPPKIASDELLPKARIDEGFLAREGITVRSGVRIAAASDDEVADDASRAPSPPVRGPLRLRQAPGPKNPLGRIKFNMSNPFDVYLHDTPNKAPFQSGRRALSHGCVRVGDARGLAAAVMSDMPGWPEERRKAALSGWQTRHASLAQPVPVHIVYATAWVDASGETQFREDVYGRDAALAERWGRPRAVRPAPRPVVPAPGAAAEPPPAAPPAPPAAVTPARLAPVVPPLVAPGPRPATAPL